MINIYLTLGYVAAILLFLSTPGPVTVLVSNTSAQSGYKAGLYTIMGTNVASLVLMTISILMIKGMLLIDEQLLSWLTLFGGLYLLYFSITIFQERIDIEQIRSEATKQIKTKYFSEGFMVGISNPKDVLFFISFLPAFFTMSDNKYLAIALLVGIWVILDYAILSIYAVVFSKITSDRLVNNIGKLSAIILFLVAVYAVFSTSKILFNGG